VGPVLALRSAPRRRESYAQLGGLDCEHGGGSDVEEANCEASRNKWILELQDRREGRPERRGARRLPRYSNSKRRAKSGAASRGDEVLARADFRRQAMGGAAGRAAKGMRSPLERVRENSRSPKLAV